MTANPFAPALGVYEKALDGSRGWAGLLEQARAAGFDFVEMSIDDDPDRLARLKMSEAERANLREIIARTGVPIRSITLSAHRRYPLGSADPYRRDMGAELLAAGVGLAADLGIEIIQIAGYYSYDEARDGGERDRFLSALRVGASRAEDANILLGLENMDGLDVLTMADAESVLAEVGSPSLRLYPDVGNLAANALDVCGELAAARAVPSFVQLKDTRLGVYRRVAFGDGIVPFTDVFATLDRGGFRGPYVVEMWNDGLDDPGAAASQARAWVTRRLLDSIRGGA